MLTPDQPPPEDYYQNNCRVLFEFVQLRYARLLPDDVRRSVQSFMAANDDEQRLFARLLTRKGPVIRTDKIDYREIKDTDASIAGLERLGLVKGQAPQPADVLLNAMRKDELLVVFSRLGSAAGRLRKTELIDVILGRYCDRSIFHRCVEYMSWLTVSDPDYWALVKMLYFGDPHQDWSAFVIRDLGMVRFEEVPMHHARFSGLPQLHLDQRVRYLGQLTKRLAEQPALALELIAALQGLRCEDRFTESRRQRALLRLGKWFEQSGQTEEAIRVYCTAAEHPARERVVRLLQRQGDTAKAEQCLAEIRANPLSEEELQFAQRFGKRGGGYQPPQTERHVDAARRDVEQQALELILGESVFGCYEPWGAHVENSLFRTLTGLIYWRAIFADVPGAFCNPFQTGPIDLYREDFAELRREILDEIEARISTDEALYQHLQKTVEDKYGIASSLVNWPMLERLPIGRIIEAIPGEHIRRITAFLIRNLRTHSKGMPDLLVVRGPGDYELVEVKGPTDQLQPTQRIWFRQFAAMGIPAAVLKLKLVKAVAD